MSELNDRVRYRALRGLGKCSRCGMPLPFPGPVRKLYCAHCQGLNERDATFWVEVLQYASRETAVGVHGFEVKEEPPPAELASDPVDAPDWLVGGDLPGLRLFGAALEGPGGELGPTVPQEARPVVMSCPKCGAALEVTGESERSVTCQYCQSAVYLPDPLWQQLHPVQQAGWWYVEYRGGTAAERREAAVSDKLRARVAHAMAEPLAPRPGSPAGEPEEPVSNKATIFVVLACVLSALGVAAYFLLR